MVIRRARSTKKNEYNLVSLGLDDSVVCSPVLEDGVVLDSAVNPSFGEKTSQDVVVLKQELVHDKVVKDKT